MYEAKTVSTYSKCVVHRITLEERFPVAMILGVRRECDLSLFVALEEIGERPA